MNSDDIGSFDYHVLRELSAQQKRIDKQPGDIPAIYLYPYPLALNPVPLASSPAAFAFTSQPWPCRALACYVSIFVTAPNDGANYWTAELYDTAGTLLANPNTSTIAGGTWARLNPAIGVQPAATSPRFYHALVATGAPGPVFAVITLAVLRTG